MRFKELGLDDKEVIVQMYNNEELSKAEVQRTLSTYFDVSERTIRNWALQLGVGVMAKNIVDPSKIMIYDIETSRTEAKVFWTGKTFISHNQLKGEPKIISVSWKWLGDDTVHHLHWDLEKNCDKQLLTDFVPEYNKADLVVGYNNNNFDNRWVNARAMKYGLPINVFVKSYDLMKKLKKYVRIPSYAMAYVAPYFGCTLKLSHEGIIMWDKIEDGTMEEKLEYIQKMLDYNIGDIITTEEIFLKLRKYLGTEINMNMLQGGTDKWRCPWTGSEEVQLDRVTSTKAGTMQYIMRGEEGQYKISQRDYNKFMEYKLDKIGNDD